MTHTVGIVCNGCGKAEVLDKVAYNTSDKLPPTNWYSVCQWLDGGIADSVEYHACSAKCLKGVGEYLKKIIDENKKVIKKLSKEEVHNLDVYCIYCKDKRIMENGTIRVSDSGRRMAVGTCSECGGKVNRILGKAN